MKYNHRQCQLVSFSFFSYTYCRIQYWFRISKRNALTQTGETYRTCCTWFCGADPDWRRRAKLGLCPTIPLHDDATRTTACWLIAGRRDVSVARTDRKREEREMRTCRDVQSIKRERETERDGEREKISGTWWKRRWYGRRNKRKSTRSTSAARLTAAATNIFLILNNSFFSFDLALSLHFSDTSVCSHQPWNRRRPKQFSPKDHPAAVSLGSFFLVSPSPTGSMRIYKEHEPYVSTQVWWRAFGNHCSSAHPFSFFFFVFCVSWSITRSKRCAQG